MPAVCETKRSGSSVRWIEGVAARFRLRLGVAEVSSYHHFPADWGNRVISLDTQTTLQQHHRDFIGVALSRLQQDPKILGLAVGGSFLTNTMDEFSDLDLIIAVDRVHYDEVLARRATIAASLGPLLASFTGEHVSEPRLLICLYDSDPPLHVDLKFVCITDFANRVEDPAVVWDRTGQLAAMLETRAAQFSQPDKQWIEDRFWVWIHYVTAKIGRGELFEALESLSFLRSVVLGPLLLVKAGARPSGVRRLEVFAPSYVTPLISTTAAYDRTDCFRALMACAELYRTLRDDHLETQRRTNAEEAAMAYLHRTAARFGSGPHPWGPERISGHGPG